MRSSADTWVMSTKLGGQVCRRGACSTDVGRGVPPPAGAGHDGLVVLEQCVGMRVRKARGSRPHVETSCTVGDVPVGRFLSRGLQTSAAALWPLTAGWHRRSRAGSVRYAARRGRHGAGQRAAQPISTSSGWAPIASTRACWRRRLRSQPGRGACSTKRGRRRLNNRPSIRHLTVGTQELGVLTGVANRVAVQRKLSLTCCSAKPPGDRRPRHEVVGSDDSTDSLSASGVISGETLRGG